MELEQLVDYLASLKGVWPGQPLAGGMSIFWNGREYFICKGRFWEEEEEQRQRELLQQDVRESIDHNEPKCPKCGGSGKPGITIAIDEEEEVLLCTYCRYEIGRWFQGEWHPIRDPDKRE